MVRFNADVDDELARCLRHALVDDGITFAEWLRRQINAYLTAYQPNGKRRGIMSQESLDEARKRPVGVGRRRSILTQEEADQAVQKAKGRELSSRESSFEESLAPGRRRIVMSQADAALEVKKPRGRKRKEEK